MPKVFAFTGISGTGVRTALEEFVSKANLNAKVVSIDMEVWDCFICDAKESEELRLGIDLKASSLEPGSKPDWWAFLELPLSRVRYYWREGARRALKVVQSAPVDVVLLTFHACYQSDNYRWRLSAVDPALLREFNASAFFTLIDDIYDVYRRRREIAIAERAILANIPDKWRCVEQMFKISCDFLEQLVTWRQEEILVTDLLSVACASVPSHVIAVKHPWRTLLRLIKSPNVACYLSHPITAIRGNAQFLQSAELREIQDAASGLRGRMTLIEPTTIDEFRVRKCQSGRLAPILTDRWPLAAEENDLLSSSLLSPVRWNGLELLCNVEHIDYFQLGETVNQVLEDSEHDAVDLLVKAVSDVVAEQSDGLVDAVSQAMASMAARIRAMETVSHAVASLAERIGEDITWRDHRLVDQTKSLVVYRPSFNGVASSGVRAELQYFRKLVRSGESVGVGLMYSPTVDAASYADHVAGAVVDAWAQDTTILTSVRPRLNELSEDDMGQLRSEIAAAFSQVDNDAERSSALAVASFERFCSIVSAMQPPRPMGGGMVSSSRQQEDRIRGVLRGVALRTMQEMRALEDLARASSVTVVRDIAEMHRIISDQ